MKLIPTKEAFEIFSFGLFSIEETAAGIKSSLTNKVEAKAAAGAEKKIEMQKLLDTKEKQEDEKLLEAKPKADKTENFGDKIKKSTGGFFKRLMTVIAALLGGWLLDKLPKIIKAVTNFIDMSKKIFGHVMDFVGSIMTVSKELGDVANQFIADYEKDGIKAALFKSDELKKEMADLDKAIRGVNGEGGVVDQWNKSWEGINKAITDYAGDPKSKRALRDQTEKEVMDLADNNRDWTPLLQAVGTKSATQVGGVEKEDLTNMSIKKVEELRGDGEGAGKYNLKALVPLAKMAGLKPSDKFSNANQDIMAIALMRSKGISSETIEKSPEIAKRNMLHVFPHIEETAQALERNEDGDVVEFRPMWNRVGLDQAFAKFKLSDSKDKVESNTAIDSVEVNDDTDDQKLTAEKLGFTKNDLKITKRSGNATMKDNPRKIESETRVVVSWTDNVNKIGYINGVGYDYKAYHKQYIPLSDKKKLKVFGVWKDSVEGQKLMNPGSVIEKVNTNDVSSELNNKETNKKIVTVPINTGGNTTVAGGNGNSKKTETTVIVVDNSLSAVNQINAQFT